MSRSVFPRSLAVFVYSIFVTVPLTNAIGDAPEPLPVENSEAADEKSMKVYDEQIEYTDARIRMIPIPAGEFIMGSPESEADRNDDEGPQHRVKIDAFWMSECEITWEAFEIWMFDLDIQRRKAAKIEPNARDLAADEYQLTQPTAPYMNMDFGMGKRGYPAICMTQLAARTFCNWLTQKTGRYYRLPTEAEWEYACRAGTTTAYSWGDNTDEIDDYAWYYENAAEKYQKVKGKKPNPWGLYDMHGNVSEWVLDQYDEKYYSTWADKVADNPLLIPKTIYPRVVRGGSWEDDADLLRSAARVGSDPAWKQQDPQIPKSIWYHTDATGVGFRILRPLKRPSDEEINSRWGKSEPVEDRKKGRI